MVDRVPIENLILCPPDWNWDLCPHCGNRVEVLEVRYPEDEEDAETILTAYTWYGPTQYVMHPCQHYTGGSNGVLTARQVSLDPPTVETPERVTPPLSAPGSCS